MWNNRSLTVSGCLSPKGADMPRATLLRAVLMRLLLAGGSTLPNIVPFPKRYTPVQDGVALRLAQDFEVTKADDSADPEGILELAVSRYTKLLKLTRRCPT